MNTVTTRPGRTQQQHPPSSTLTVAPRRTQRVALIDRLALRVGVALVAWSRRPRTLDSRVERERRVTIARATEKRERAMHRSMVQLLPPR